MADQSQLELWADEFATDETTSARHNTPRLARIGSPSTPPARFVQQLASQVSHPRDLSTSIEIICSTTLCTDPASRMSEMAGRVPSTCPDSASRQHSGHRSCRAGWRATNAAVSRCAYDGHGRLSPRASARLCCPHQPVGRFRHRFLAHRCGYVPCRKCSPNSFAHGGGNTAP